MIESWAGIVEQEAIELHWRSHHVSIGGDGDIAIGRGPYAFETTEDSGALRCRIGEFSSVWVRKNACALRLVLFDGNLTPPLDVTEADEMKAPLAAAPDTCFADK